MVSVTRASALAGIATVAATIALGALLFGRGAGTLAGLLLATTFDWSYRARTVQLDTLLALFETTALLAFWRWHAPRRDRTGQTGQEGSRETARAKKLPFAPERNHIGGKCKYKSAVKEYFQAEP